MQRRTLLKTVGGIGTASAVGVGSLALSGGASAEAVNITASAATVENDRGDVSSVTIDPSFKVQWSGLDDAVAKVFYLIEAKIGDGDFKPLFRATPWLEGTTNGEVDETGPGTSGHYEIINSHSEALHTDARFSDGEGADETPTPLVVADEVGAPDYASADWSTYAAGDETSYLDGTSVGTAAEAETFLVDDSGLTLQNNYPDGNCGYYGAAADTSTLDNPDGGTDNVTPITLRYTFELQRPNENYVSYAEGEGVDLSGVRGSDVVGGNSPIVMNGEDDQHEFANPAAIPYADLRANAGSHVGAISTTASFDVTATNIAGTGDASGQTNSDAS